MSDGLKAEIVAIAGRLLEEGKVGHFLAYQQGTVGFKTSPLLARRKEELSRVWVEDFCIPNLASYLKEIKGPVGLLVKGCDSRSLVSLLKEGQVQREDLYIVGLPCPGQIDTAKVAEEAGGELHDLEGIVRRGSEIAVRIDGREEILPLARALFPKCLDCRYPKPVLADVLLPGEYVRPVPEGLRPEDELRGKAAAERWAFWAEQFERCIRCYACRNVCPSCFCPQCIVETNLPQWVSPVPTPGDNFVFHLMRLMHVAGTCVSCGECQRVCPMGLPLMKMNEKMNDDIQELFQFVAGVDPEQPLPFRTFQQDEASDFFK